MSSVSVNPPKTPVTEGSNTVAAATLPNVCKMPGPPAPFVPTPLPNIARSSISPEGFSKNVQIEGKNVAIKGASFGSQGDVAAKGTGGGLVSANTEGPAKFVGPGSMDVSIEGGNVHLLGDPMLNNCGPGGSPVNAATLAGALHSPLPSVPPKPCPGHEAGGEPACPQTEEEFRDRRNKLADAHERAAAIHNEKGILAAEGSLRRKHGQRQSALTYDDQHQVTHTCRHCGAPMDGEIEHVSEDNQGKKHAVEAKSGEDFFPAKSPQETARNQRQMQRYAALAKNSDMGIMYKIPKGHDKAARQIKALAKQCEIPSDVLQVIFI